MDVIHFTKRAADPLKAFGAAAAAPAVSFLPLADGEGDTHISCLHLEMGGKIEAPSITHAAALLVVHGRLTIETPTPQIRIDLHAGSGCIVEEDEAYSLKSEEGAILLIVESKELTAHARAISTPQRIAGATWPSDTLLGA
jgi:redox-sensitive bicupin YhaK (pirin superfamily)